MLNLRFRQIFLARVSLFTEIASLKTHKFFASALGKKLNIFHIFSIQEERVVLRKYHEILYYLVPLPVRRIISSKVEQLLTRSDHKTINIGVKLRH